MSYQPPPPPEQPTEPQPEPRYTPPQPQQYTPPPQQRTQVNVQGRKRSPLPYILGGIGALLVLCVVCSAAGLLYYTNTANLGTPTAVAVRTVPTVRPTDTVEAAPATIAAEPTDTSSPPTIEPTSLPTETAAADPTLAVAPEPTVATTVPTAAGENPLYEIGEPIARKSEFVNILTVVGVIKYKGTEPRSNVRVSVTLTDAAGKVLATTPAIGTPVLIKPDSNIPYKALISDAPAYEKIEVSISTDEVSSFTSAFFYTDLEVVDASVQKGGPGGTVRVVGRVKNVGQKGVNLVSVTAVLYGADGKVLDVSSGIANIAGTLAPGQDSPFSVDFFGVEGAETFETSVWGTPAP